ARAVEEFIARTGLPPNLADAINFFNNQLFLAKRWNASIGMLGVRNTLLANVFQEKRDAVFGDVVLPVEGDFAGSNTVNQTGVGLQWNLRLSPLVAWNIGWSYSRNEFPGTDEVDKIRYLGMSLSREFERRLSGSLGYRQQRSDSTQPGLTYTENAVIATLR